MMIQKKTKCPWCGKENIVKVKEEDWKRYKNGELIQRAFPYLNGDEREMLITGICPECWNKEFDEEEW